MASDSELQDHIRSLHEELESSSSIDDDARKQLGVLLNDIQVLLEREGADTAPSRESLIESLEAATSEFETSHPTLYATVGRLINTLSNLGI
ncbi:MAG: DUF4404 family protein [Candidatus Binatia bacterium]|nr:DUF4404 family protein [Candidatus Binatia bacterium]